MQPSGGRQRWSGIASTAGVQCMYSGSMCSVELFDRAIIHYINMESGEYLFN